MTPHHEPLRGEALRTALAAIIARPVTELPTPDDTLANEQRRLNGRNAAHAQGRTVWAMARAMRTTAKVSTRSSTTFKPGFDHDAALAMAKGGASTSVIAEAFGVTRKSINRMLQARWPGRPKRRVVRSAAP